MAEEATGSAVTVLGQQLYDAVEQHFVQFGRVDQLHHRPILSVREQASRYNKNAIYFSLAPVGHIDSIIMRIV